MFNIDILKDCERCSGELFVEINEETTSICCLQCGAVHAVKQPVLEFKQTRSSKELVSTR